jgi:hypothetical protein
LGPKAAGLAQRLGVFYYLGSESRVLFFILPVDPDLKLVKKQLVGNDREIHMIYNCKFT